MISDFKDPFNSYLSRVASSRRIDQGTSEGRDLPFCIFLVLLRRSLLLDVMLLVNNFPFKLFFAVCLPFMPWYPPPVFNRTIIERAFFRNCCQGDVAPIQTVLLCVKSTQITTCRRRVNHFRMSNFISLNGSGSFPF